MPESYSPRGFAQYLTLQDSYGAEVRVYESSAAMMEGEDRGPWVWLNIEGGRLGSGNAGSSHLDIRHAVKVRDALSEFIDANEEHLPDESCHAKIFHGPGHQSTTNCELKGEHDVHEAHVQGVRLLWRGDEGITGFFDESPLDD